MVTLSQMLPPNATTLELAIADIAPRQLLDALTDAPRRLRSTMPDAVMPWLASEWFLSDFIGYFPDVRALLAAGLPWLKVRGTAAAVKQALSWIGMTATLEEDGARLQLDLGASSVLDNLAAIKHLVGASIPAHVQLYRLYHGYDLRLFRLDFSQLDEALLDDDSGVWQGDVKLSFGTRHAVHVDADDMPINGGMTSKYSTRVWGDDSWRMDTWKLDSEILIDASSGIVIQHSSAVPPDVEDLPECACINFRIIALSVDIESPDIAGRIDQWASTLTDDVRGWAGPWTGTWREPIPSRSTFYDF